MEEANLVAMRDGQGTGPPAEEDEAVSKEKEDRLVTPVMSRTWEGRQSSTSSKCNREEQLEDGQKGAGGGYM